MPIPCRCDGLISEKCTCSSLHKNSSDASVSTTPTRDVKRMLNQTDSYEHRALYDIQEESKTNTVMKTFEEFYETCLGYNLRYCSLSGFVKHNGDYFQYMLKDVTTLIFFLITNFVVFLAIASKTFVHMLLLLFIILQWIFRTLLPNDTTEQTFTWSSNSLQSRYQVEYLSPLPKSDDLKSSSVEQT